MTLRASRDGFQTRTQALSWRLPADEGIDLFWLEALQPPIGLDPGEYTLTVAIDLTTTQNGPAPCPGFPVDLASRSYRATIVETSDPSIVFNHLVSADDPTLRWHNLLGFGIVGRFVGFGSDDSFQISEEFSGFRYLDIYGSAPTTEPAIATGSSVSIPFRGQFRYCQLKSPRGGYNDCSQVPAEQIVDYHFCTSDHATMVFTKR